MIKDEVEWKEVKTRQQIIRAEKMVRGKIMKRFICKFLIAKTIGKLNENGFRERMRYKG